MHVQIRDGSVRKPSGFILVYASISEIYLAILKQLATIYFFGQYSYKSHCILKRHYKNMLVSLEFALDDSENFDFLLEEIIP